MRNNLADLAFTVDCSPTSAAPPPANGHPESAPLPPGEQEPLLIDEPAAAEMLCVSPRTLFELRKKGLIRHVELPGIRGIRYSTAYLSEWIAAHTKGS